MDYGVLAKQYNGKVDYGALAKQSGGFPKQEPASVAQAFQAKISPFNPKVPNSQFTQPTPAGATQMQYKPEDNTNVTFGKVAKELPKATLQTAVGAPVKLAISAGEGIGTTFKTGGQENASGQTYNLPGLDPFKSFQSESIDRAKAGQNPLLNIAQGGFETGMAGLDTIGVGELATKGVKGALSVSAKMAEKSALKDATELVQPVMNKKLAINTLKSSGKTGMGAEEKGILGSIKPKTTPKVESIAADVKGLVSKNNTPVKNITNINDEIARVSEKELLPTLKNNKVSIRNTTAMQRVDQLEPTRLIKSDTALNNTYKQVKDLMAEKIAQFSKDAKSIDTEGLWNARKQFDHEVEQQFGDAIYNPEKNSAVKQAVRDVREQVNEMIAEHHSDFRPQLKKLSNLYTARDTIAERNYKILFTDEAGKYAKFKANHPIATKIGKGTAEVLGAGAVYEGVKKMIGH